MSKQADSQDIYFIEQTLTLAQKAEGLTNPNPMVGAVLVKKGRIIGQGYHHQAGKLHAEIEAIKSAQESVTGSTLYINLEPCTHFGRTPPCADAIIQAGITKVVCATKDPNPKVAGKGIKKLQAAGIIVKTNILASEAKKINESFFTFHEKKRPFVVLKFAASLDGKIATREHDSQWITNPAAREFTRSLRGVYQGIVVGINTVLRDNPHLGVRKKRLKDPVRIILDSHLKIPLNSQVLRNNNVVIATTAQANQEKKRQLIKRGVALIDFKGQKIKISELLRELAKREIISVLVEGGSKVLGSFVDEKLFDKVYCCYAPIFIGGKEAPSVVGGRGIGKMKDAVKLTDIAINYFGDNWIVSGYHKS